MSDDQLLHTGSPQSIGRRSALAFLAMLFCSPIVHAENGVSDDEIVLGQTCAMTGPLGELCQASSSAAKTYFDYVNQQGGINGRKIRLITLDDGYNADKGVANTQTLVEREKVFALFNVFGTPTNIAILPYIAKEGIPSIAPFTGSQVTRAPLNRMVFNVRAGYDVEIDKIIEQLGVRGIEKIAVVYQNNAFGREGLADVETALAKRKLKVQAAASIENDASDVVASAKKLASVEPHAVIMITAGKPSVEFIKAYNNIAIGMQFFTLSVMGTQTSIDALGKDGVGLVVSQVAPYPFSATSGVVREYQQIMKKMGVKNWSFTSMEGFLNAKVAVEGLKRAGRNLTRERFVGAMESMGKLDFDGYLINFSHANHDGSQYVDLTQIARNGQFLR